VAAARDGGPAARPRLILFDIDGTLLTAKGAGRRAFTRALTEVYGTAGPVEAYDFRGKTDPRIVLDLLGAMGIPPPEIERGLTRCFEIYTRALAEEIEARAGAVVTLPGVAALVRALARTEGLVLGLLTGNIEAGARIKLAPTGLGPYFRTGAYGSDDADRRRLPALAARRAEALAGRRLAAGDVVVVGDTPHDLDCARAFGARAVAVATGQYPRAELAALGPDLLFDDFADVERAARLLGG
jgi:phosphoglycolate phosphatase